MYVKGYVVPSGYIVTNAAAGEVTFFETEDAAREYYSDEREVE